MFDKTYFDNSFDLVQQCKNGSFQVHVLVHKKVKSDIDFISLVKININRTKSRQQLCLINVNFDF